MAKEYFSSGNRNRIYLDELITKINDEIKNEGEEEFKFSE